MAITLTDLSLFFFIYAFVGWCVEVVYYTVTTGEFVNRGFLNGPICPVYGVAFSIIIIILTPLNSNLVCLFLGSVALATAIEFLTGFVLEKIFNDKWWDYSEEPFNIKGYVCLKFSLLWGLACTMAMRVLHPLINGAVERMPQTVKTVLVIIFYVCLSCDIIVTVAAIRKLKIRIKAAKEIAERFKDISDYIGEEISDITLNVMEKTEDGREKLQSDIAAKKQKHRENHEIHREKISAELEELKEKYQNYLEKYSFTQKRLDKAFPHLDFSRKLDDRKTLKEKIRIAIEKYKNNSED